MTVGTLLGQAAGRATEARLSGPTPNLVWSDDPAWFVHTGVDFDSTYIGGPESLTSALLASELEVLEVSPDDDVTSGSDRINCPDWLRFHG